jgi:RNA-directed DNA polymerase
MSFDIEKAFDKAPHFGILKSLNDLRCPKVIGKWLCSFLSNREFEVEINGCNSNRKKITAGVPQGSPLSPILFSLFINKIGAKLDKCKVHYALYADDLNIWKIHSRIDHINKQLQTSTTKIYNFFNKIGLTKNAIILF